jgi:antagonist of KipI
MIIQIVKPGLLTTIQDLGRYGYQKFGVVVGGAVDSFAAQIANLLVGNQGGESVLEFTVQGPTLYFQTDALIAICGSDMSPTIEHMQVPQWRPVFVRAGHTLKFQTSSVGCRTYLAIAGGFDVPQVLGSRSTFLRAGFGGIQGRAVVAGDVLASLNPSHLSQLLAARLHDPPSSSLRPFTAAKWGISHPLYSYIPNPKGLEPICVRVMHGLEYSRFDSESQEYFFNRVFRVTAKSDRMGCRLSGPKLMTSYKYDMISEAVTVGTIQVPTDGNPIILLADRQTTGGYPRIAQVASIDIPKIGQCMPGTLIQFRNISLAEAQALYLNKVAELTSIAHSIRYTIQRGS